MQQFLKPVIVLTALAAAGAVLLTFVHIATKPRVVANSETALLRTLNQVIPSGIYDNRLHADVIRISANELGSEETLSAWRARSGGKPAALAMTVIAPDGYGGPIRLLVGVSADGILMGVRVLAHDETQGFGDAIELGRSEWILGFSRRSLDHPPLNRWGVRGDGGAFDQLSGATITSRAVVLAVKRALLYFDAHRDWLFSAKPAAP